MTNSTKFLAELNRVKIYNDIMSDYEYITTDVLIGILKKKRVRVPKRGRTSPDVYKRILYKEVMRINKPMSISAEQNLVLDRKMYKTRNGQATLIPAIE